MPSASRRNRWAIFLAPPGDAAPRDPVYNTPGTQWVLVCEEWIEVQDMLPSRGERLADGVDVTARPCRVRMLYRDDITAAMRIRLDDENGRLLQIVSEPAELGFREGLELVAEQLSVMGDAA